MHEQSTVLYRQQYGDGPFEVAADSGGAEPEQVILKTADGELLKTPEGQIARFPAAWLVHTPD